MVRKDRKMRKPLINEDHDHDGDDDYTNIEDVDMNALSDSEEEYTETERKLLEKARTKHTAENFDSDDEVYGLQDDSEDEDDQHDSMESDIEGLQEDDDMPDENAWGHKKRTFYSADYVDQDYASISQTDLVNAEIEGQEVANIRKRLEERLTDAAFAKQFAQTVKNDEDEHLEDNQITSTDISKKKTKQEEEYKLSLMADFIGCMTEAKNILVPFLKLVQDGTCPDCDAVAFIKTKYQLILNYCGNICFYLMLKVKKLNAKSHPVMKRLTQYRELYGQLLSKQENLLEEVTSIIKAVKNNEPLYTISDSSEIKTDKRISRFENLKESQQKPLISKKDYVQDIKNNKISTSMLNDMEEEEEGKRAITYQMAKNRGLTPYRKKELRNPRVKHRNKYRKAKIRRKGMVREVRREYTRYTGEISGIKAGVKKGIKLK